MEPTFKRLSHGEHRRKVPTSSRSDLRLRQRGQRKTLVLVSDRLDQVGPGRVLALRQVSMTLAAAATIDGYANLRMALRAGLTGG